MISEEQIKAGLDKAYLEAGSNAYFSNGFYAGIKFMQENQNSGMQYPNKTFIADFIKETPIGKIRSVMLIVAKNEEVAALHLKELLNIKPNLVWLMDCNYPTIYDQKGNVPLPRQAKIIWNQSTKI